MRKQIIACLIQGLGVVSLLACSAKKTPAIPTPSIFGTQNQPVSPEVRPVWVYIEAQDNIKKKTLEQIQDLTEPIEAPVPGGMSLRKYLKQTAMPHPHFVLCSQN